LGVGFPAGVTLPSWPCATLFVIVGSCLRKSGGPGFLRASGASSLRSAAWPRVARKRKRVPRKGRQLGGHMTDLRLVLSCLVSRGEDGYGGVDIRIRKGKEGNKSGYNKKSKWETNFNNLVKSERRGNLNGTDPDTVSVPSAVGSHRVETRSDPMAIPS